MNSDHKRRINNLMTMATFSLSNRNRDQANAELARLRGAPDPEPKVEPVIQLTRMELARLKSTGLTKPEFKIPKLVNYQEAKLECVGI